MHISPMSSIILENHFFFLTYKSSRVIFPPLLFYFSFFFFNDPAPTEFSPLPLPAALPISPARSRGGRVGATGSRETRAPARPGAARRPAPSRSSARRTTSRRRRAAAPAPRVPLPSPRLEPRPPPRRAGRGVAPPAPCRGTDTAGGRFSPPPAAARSSPGKDAASPPPPPVRAHTRDGRRLDVPRARPHHPRAPPPPRP